MDYVVYPHIGKTDGKFLAAVHAIPEQGPIKYGAEGENRLVTEDIQSRHKAVIEVNRLIDECKRRITARGDKVVEVEDIYDFTQLPRSE